MGESGPDRHENWFVDTTRAHTRVHACMQEGEYKACIPEKQNLFQLLTIPPRKSLVNHSCFFVYGLNPRQRVCCDVVVMLSLPSSVVETYEWL